MDALKKMWWVFGVCAVAVGYMNPYFGMLTMMPCMLLMIDSIFILIGRLRRKHLNDDGIKGLIIHLQRYLFWIVLFVNFAFYIAITYIATIFIYSPNRKNMQIFSVLSPIGDSFVTIAFACYIVLFTISLSLYSLRMHELFWKKHT